jgi:ketosteroid isomerase-like protein
MKASNQRKDEGEAKQHRNKPEREEAEGGSARGSTPVERMYFAWNDALSRNDAQTLLALYAEDAHFESPLVPHLLGGESGVLCGREQLKPLFAMLAERKPSARQYYRTGYLTDGKRLIWEYPRDAGRGEQMDFTEVMELNDDGLIGRHCVYWGWFGVRVLQRNDYHR